MPAGSIRTYLYRIIAGGRIHYECREGSGYMRAKGFVRLTAAVQTFLLLTSLVVPGMVAASVPPSVSASWAGGIVTVLGADFGATEAVGLSITVI